jgi:hypothetical protein
MPVIPATQELEFGRMIVQGYPGKKLVLHISTNTYAIPTMWEVEVGE